MDSWKISRAGVLNFWYYDEEYFDFDSGRLLLRGANGSGKSVTMQSLVPLLFDGNKSPERLDPFGSRARRMESYLLSDGLDLEERTGYLFLEFEKESTGAYMTIGMGMRARRNMAMQTWYFIVLDGRRIGAGHELLLYRDLGGKVPFTQKELENRLGSGGRVMTRQSDYKAAVNEHLFGFGDVEEFDELIELLIQLRSPKLSKEFKPTTMYEIMQNSLQTLTDDDLRPMSESIESMDEIKSKIEGLERARQSLERIGAVYGRYNEYCLALKAQSWLRCRDRLRGIDREMDELGAGLEASRSRLAELEGLMSSLDDEERLLAAKAESLRKHDFSNLISEKGDLEERLKADSAKLETKEGQLELQRAQLRSLDRDIRSRRDGRDSAMTSIAGLLDVMDGLGKQAGFDEHAFFRSELTAGMDGGFTFSYHEDRVASWRRGLREGLKLIEEQERIERDHDASLLQLTRARSERESQERRLSDALRLLSETKDEYIESMYRWHGTLGRITIPRTSIGQSAERVHSYGMHSLFDDIIAPARGALHEEIGAFSEALGEVRLKKQDLERQRGKLEAELEELRRTKDVEPPRDERVARSRERLASLGIHHIPLFMAVDFRDDVDEELRGRLEEALMDMGLLDALIVAPEHRETVLRADEGMADRYIFAEPELFSHNISGYLKPEAGGSLGLAGTIDDALLSVFLDMSGSRPFITETGQYGMGILRGHASGTKTPRYIGQKSRRDHRLSLMSGLEESLSSLGGLIRDEQARITELEGFIAEAYAALERFPRITDLDVAFRESGREDTELQRLSDIVVSLSEQADGLHGRLRDKRIEVQSAVSGLYLPPNKQAFGDAAEAMDEYASRLGEVRLEHKDYLNALDALRSLEIQLERTESLIDGYAIDVRDLERSCRSARDRIGHIEGQLSLDDYRKVMEELESCLSRQRELPPEKNSLAEEKGICTEGIRTFGSKLSDLHVSRDEAQAMMSLADMGIDGELELGYVMEYEMPSDGEGKARIVDGAFRAYRSVLEERRGGRSLLDSLQEFMIVESSQLAEYNMKRVERFAGLTAAAEELGAGREFADDLLDRAMDMQRIDIVGRISGREASFHELISLVEQKIAENGMLLDEQDRELFEEILIKSVSRKISARIWHSERWVETINRLMGGMNTSSGLVFHLKWEARRAEREDQLETAELVELLRQHQGMIPEESRERMIRHFRSKIQESRARAGESTGAASFLAIMKDILDYRKWFEFKLFYTKKGDKRRELTNNAFFTFSGGEKAMAMYVPLFSAVNAKYDGGGRDCPRVVSLDEAFAGVDEKNIRNMFELLIELDLSFVANSQVLYGDYDTVPSLSVYELIRPENVTFVTLLKYRWNGTKRELVMEGLEEKDG